MKIPLSAPDITEPEIQAVVSVLRGPRLSLGPKMEALERAMAEYVRTSHAVAVSSGTSGLHLCMRALGIGEGDEVIVPSFTFIAAANAIRYERAQPVFVDVDPVTLNADPAKIEVAITPRTRAILVVHTFGVPAEMAAILDLAKRHRLLVIEDACEAIGGEYRGRKAGSMGTAGVFAFYPNKQITMGEGGMIVTRDAEAAKRMRALRNHGRYDSKDWFQHTEIGYNYRISEINCALGLEQLKRIDSILKRREVVARSYDCILRSNPDLILPAIDVTPNRISWFVYVVRLAGRFTQADRDAVVREMASKQIECGRYFAPIHLQPAYAAWNGLKNLTVTESQAERALALPFFNTIKEAEIERVSHCLTSALRRIGSG